MPPKRPPINLTGVRAPDLVHWLYERRRHLALVGATLLVVAVAGWGYSTWRGQRESAAQVLLTEAVTAMEKVLEASPDEKKAPERDQEMRGILERLTNIRQQHPTSRAAEQALLQMGHVHYHLGDYQRALDAFQEYLERYAAGPGALIGGLGKAYALEALGRTQEAAALFRSVADRQQHTLLSAEALLGLGRTLTHLNQAPEAEKAYRRVLEEFPGSLWALRAEELMASMGR